MSWMSKKPEVINKVVHLPIDEISKNPGQPRKNFDAQAIAMLASSIKQNGLLQPITVRSLEIGGYELIAGERRLLACIALGKTQIPAIIIKVQARTSAVLALIENLHRADLNCFEQAQAINALLTDLNISQQEVARLLCKSQPAIANKLRLLKLPPKAQELLVEHGLTERHARALLKVVDQPNLLDIIQIIITKALTVEKTEKYIERCIAIPPKKAQRAIVVKDVRLLFNSIAKAVDSIKQGGFEVETLQTQDDKYVSYVVRIPRDRIYITQDATPKRRA